MTYTEEELKQVPGEFTPSPFVKRSQVWTMSVREVQSLPVEMAGCYREKTGENGVTTAVAAREWRIHFE